MLVRAGWQPWISAMATNAAIAALAVAMIWLIGLGFWLFFYFAGSWALASKTPGMAVLGLRVVQRLAEHLAQPAQPVAQRVEDVEAQKARHEDAGRSCAHSYRLPSLLSFS